MRKLIGRRHQKLELLWVLKFKVVDLKNSEPKIKSLYKQPPRPEIAQNSHQGDLVIPPL